MKVIPSPVPHADFVTFTTYKTLMGGRGGVIMSKRLYADHIDRSVFPGCQGTPAMNLVAAKAACFHLAKKPEFRQLQQQTLSNARHMAAEFQSRGYRVVSGGTENHLVLVDLRPQKITGDWAEKQLESAGLIINRNPIPGDRENPKTAGGIRLGTPAITTRGMKEAEVATIVDWIDTLLKNPSRNDFLASIKQNVANLCQAYPVPH